MNNTFLGGSSLDTRHEWTSRIFSGGRPMSSRRHSAAAAPLLILLIVGRISSASSDVALSEAAALLKLKSSFTASSPATLSSWTNDSTPCVASSPWAGVTCFHGIVTGLSLDSMGLSGTIDVDSLSHLRGLRAVGFTNNSIAGAIPDLSRLPALKAIYLSNNKFTGPIPANFFSKMAHLKKLWLSNNAITGDIPQSISKLTVVIELHLENNKFTGGIPDATLPALKSFDISNNELEGSVPPGFAKFAARAFDGNPGLCGPPLAKSCSADSAAPTAALTNKEVKSGKMAVVGAVMVTLFLVLLAVLVIVRRKRKGGFDTLEHNDGLEGVEARVLPSPGKQRPHGGSSHNSNGRKGPSATAAASPVAELVVVNDEKGVFGLPDLMKAAAEVLGSGGLGSAYKAVMASGRSVVVKRMKEMNRLGREAFDEEMRKLGRMRHPNVLTPLAYHFRKEEKLLVFDHIDKGSLLFVLHGDRGPYHKALDWPTRLKIILGVARGTMYLHDNITNTEVAHGNIKSGNVLLGRDFEPLVADYGYSPMVNAPQAAEHMSAYKTPEYIHSRCVSPKSDVYCLGVVVLEVLTGKFPTQYLGSGQGGTDVAQWAAAAVAEGREVDVIDPEIAGGAPAGMERLVRVGASMVDPNPDRRPEMREVVSQVEEIAAAEAGRGGGGGEAAGPVGPAPSLKDGLPELSGGVQAEILARRSRRDSIGERSSRRGEEGFEFAIS